MTAGRFGTLDALRVLLGTVMVVTALQYFLPALLRRPSTSLRCGKRPKRAIMR